MKKKPILPYSNSGRSGSQSCRLDRRTFLTTTGATALAALSPSPGEAAPANYMFTHGAFEITVLSDGHLIVPAPFLATNADRKELDAALAAAGQRGEWVPPPPNVTLIDTGADVILIDVRDQLGGCPDTDRAASGV